MKTNFLIKRLQDMRCFNLAKKNNVIVAAVIVSFTLLGFTGCMLPIDKYEVEDIYEEIPFSGGVIGPNVDISILAYNQDIDDFEEIATASSIGIPQDLKGYDIYHWSESVAIPEKYWMDDCASEGRFAVVRAKTLNYDLISLEQGYKNCFNQSDTFMDFISDCASSQNPNARYYTKDYRDFGQECVDRINTLRALEGLAPLQRYKERECVADDNAKYNFENGPHASKDGKKLVNGKWTGNADPSYRAQNDCSYGKSSIDNVLDDCIEQGMYYDEKPCFESYDEEDCYGGGKDGPCECGHYVNMTNISYNRVACGLYKTPDGKYYSIHNFFE